MIINYNDKDYNVLRYFIYSGDIYNDMIYTVLELENKIIVYSHNKDEEIRKSDCQNYDYMLKVYRSKLIEEKLFISKDDEIILI